MQITHEEAHRLIQFKADSNLSPTNAERLNTHLKECADCRSFLDEINETESAVRRVMHRQWNLHPLPLQLEAIGVKASSRRSEGAIVTTRRALIGIAFVMFALITWQSMATNNTTPIQTLPGVLPLIPTPSIQFTATNTLQENCLEIRYTVIEGDTLESIARKFSVSVESIQNTNNLTSNTLNPTMELIIPLCESTPTSTILPPAFTITPILETISTTPG